MKISVAGTGYVGLVAGVCFAEMGHDVTCVDVDEKKIELMKSGVSPIYEADLESLMQKNYAAGNLHYTTDYQLAYRDAEVIFIGVGTPEQPDGSANLSYIAGVSRQIAETIERDCLVVVKSTVPIGTNDKVEQFIHDFLIHDVHVEVASNPEFLAQGTAVHDTLHAARIIIGTESEWAEKILHIWKRTGSFSFIRLNWQMHGKQKRYLKSTNLMRFIILLRTRIFKRVQQNRKLIFKIR